MDGQGQKAWVDSAQDSAGTNDTYANLVTTLRQAVEGHPTEYEDVRLGAIAPVNSRTIPPIAVSNFMRFKDARLQAVLLRKTYSEHGLVE